MNGFERTQRLLLPAIVACGLVACSTEDPSRSRDDLGEAQSEMTICPADKAKTVIGIDVSYYQGDIDWNAVKNTDVKFAIARKSDGTYLDTKFQKNWDGIKAAGLIRGVYQFFEPDGDVTVQANIVIDAVGKLGNGDLPAMIDVEAAGSLSASAYAAKIQKWVDLVEAGTGKHPMIYTGKYFWDANVASSNFDSYALVNAAYPSPECYKDPSTSPNFVAAHDCWTTHCPNISDHFDDWQFWQFSSQTKVTGIAGRVDMDLFNGDMAALQLLAGGGYAGKLVSVDVPTTVIAGETISAHVTFKNVGGPAWDGSTRLGTTEPRDRESAFAAPSWIGPNRPAQVDGSVKSGDAFTFDFEMVAPSKPGLYTETFGLVQEGVTWFADEGGPDDKAVVMQFQVVDAPVGAVNAAATTGSGTTTSSSGAGGDGGAGGGNPQLSDPTCDCSVPRSAGESPWGVVAIAGLGVAIGRRRGRARPSLPG